MVAIPVCASFLAIMSATSYTQRDVSFSSYDLLNKHDHFPEY